MYLLDNTNNDGFLPHPAVNPSLSPLVSPLSLSLGSGWPRCWAWKPMMITLLLPMNNPATTPVPTLRAEGVSCPSENRVGPQDSIDSRRSRD